MEIERVVSGDLNKSLEQCVNALIAVERKVASLKNELVQTLQSVPNARQLPTVASWLNTGYPGIPTTGQFAPFPGSITPTGIPAYGLPQFAPVPQGLPQGYYGTPIPQGIYGAPMGMPIVPVPQASLPHGTFAPTPGTPLGYAPLPTHTGYPAMPLPQGFAPQFAPGYGYIW